MMNIHTNIILKKVFLISFVGFLLFPDIAFGQADTIVTPLVNKHGQKIIPEAGSIAAGIDLLPFLSYIGNFSNNTQNNAYQGATFLGEKQSLLIKYFQKENVAYRFKLGVQNHKNEENHYIRDDIAYYEDVNSQKQVVDTKNSVTNSYFVALGYERNRTTGRLRGIIGVEAMLGFENGSTNFLYGNSFSELNTSPSTYDFGNNVDGSFRLLSENLGRVYSPGINLVIAAEYFVLPNICIGAELNWGSTYSVGGQSYNEQEYWNGKTVKTIKKLSSPGNKIFNNGINNPSTGLYLMMHF